MKHIKSINEFYHRTVGFRYSNPTEKYSVICYYSGNLSKEGITSILNDVGVKYEDIDIEEGQEDIKIDGIDTRIDGTVYFDVFVYTDREIDKVLGDIGKNLYTEHNVKVADFTVRPYPKNEE